MLNTTQKMSILKEKHKELENFQNRATGRWML